MLSSRKIAILGGGNIGLVLMEGLRLSGFFDLSNIYITRRNIEAIKSFCKKEFRITNENK